MLHQRRRSTSLQGRTVKALIGSCDLALIGVYRAVGAENLASAVRGRCDFYRVSMIGQS